MDSILDDIIKGCLNYDVSAQKKLFDLYSKELLRLSLKYCDSIADAEDNVQDTFIEVYHAIDRFKNKGSFEGWIKRIAIHKAISKFKRNLPNVSLEETKNLYPIADVTIEVEEIPLNVILESIQKLPPQYRMVFSLYEMDDYSHQEIASLLEISEGTSKSNLHRAKLILKEQLTQYRLKHHHGAS